IVEHGTPREQVERLPDRRHLWRHPLRMAAEADKAQRTRAGMKQPARDLQQRAFAAAAWSDDRRDLSRRKPAGHTVEREHRRPGARRKRQTDSIKLKTCRRRTRADAHT